MPPVSRLLLAAALLALCAAGKPTTTTPSRAPVPVGPTAVVLPPSDPMASEMQREIDRGQREYAGLYRRLASAPNETEAFAIQDELRQQRVGLQIALVRIQAAYARRAGHERLATQLERVIAELIAPDAGAPSPGDPRKKL